MTALIEDSLYYWGPAADEARTTQLNWDN